MEKQIVTVTLFRFKGFGNRFWAFGQMGRRPFQKGIADGLTFGKMLGTGSGGVPSDRTPKSGSKSL